MGVKNDTIRIANLSRKHMSENSNSYIDRLPNMQLKYM